MNSGLFQPFRLHDLTLRNRIVLAPMTRARAGADRLPNRLMAEYYALRSSAGLIVTTAKTDERAFKTTVRNGHDFPIKVAIEDQLPVSESDEIVVEMLPSTTPPTTTNLRDKRGVLQWAFEVKPSEVKDIAFAWRLRWHRDRWLPGSVLLRRTQQISEAVAGERGFRPECGF